MQVRTIFTVSLFFIAWGYTSSTELHIAVSFIDSTLGRPMVNKQVYIQIPKPAYAKLLYTDASGIARDTVIMPDTTGIVEATIVDCDGLPRVKFAPFGHGPQNLNIGFNFCDQSYIPCHSEFYFHKGIQPLQVQFDSRSTGSRLVNHYWDFGDGKTATSPNPVNIFPFNGTFQVRLIITDALGRRDTSSKSVIVGTSGIGCASHFIHSADTTHPFEIRFEFDGLATQPVYFWTFGDGNAGADSTITHRYKRAGKYLACLHVAEKNASCLDVFCDTIAVLDTSRKAGLRGKILNRQVLSHSPYLMVFTGDSLPLLADSFSIPVAGTFNLYSLNKGTYYLRADPDLQDENKFMRTYYGNTPLWQESVACVISGEASNIEWNMLSHSPVGGTVNLTIEVEGLTPAQKSLARTVVASPIGFVGDFSSDSTQKFRIENILADSLIIYIDIPGYTCRPLRIDLRKSDIPEYPLRFKVLDKRIEPVKTVGLDALVGSAWSIYPNPVGGILTVNGMPPKDEIRLFHLSGVSYTPNIIKQTNQTTELDVNHLEAGVYFLKIDNLVLKIIKK